MIHQLIYTGETAMNKSIVHLLLALVACAGMFLAGATSASAQEMWFFEIQSSGKGVEADTDSDLPPTSGVYTENKHTVPKTKQYGVYVRDDRVFSLAFYIESTGVWSLLTAPVFETGNSLLVFAENPWLISVDLIDSADINLYAYGALQIKYKQKGAEVKSAQLKSLGMLYFQFFPKDPTGNTYRHGGLKMKGKKIDQADVPPEVLLVLLP
jgi:hypothetical protein